MGEFERSQGESQQTPPQTENKFDPDGCVDEQFSRGLAATAHTIGTVLGLKNGSDAVRNTPPLDLELPRGSCLDTSLKILDFVPVTKRIALISKAPLSGISVSAVYLDTRGDVTQKGQLLASRTPQARRRDPNSDANEFGVDNLLLNALNARDRPFVFARIESDEPTEPTFRLIDELRVEQDPSELNYIFALLKDPRSFAADVIDQRLSGSPLPTNIARRTVGRTGLKYWGAFVNASLQMLHNPPDNY